MFALYLYYMRRLLTEYSGGILNDKLHHFVQKGRRKMTCNECFEDMEEKDDCNISELQKCL